MSTNRARFIANMARGRRRKRRSKRMTVAKVKKIISGASEAKYLDTELDTNVVWAANSNQVCITLCPQGLDIADRIGSEIYLQNLQWRIQVLTPPTVCYQDQMVRVIMYIAKDCEGAIPTITNLLNNDNVISFREWEHKGDFRVLIDQTRVLRQTALNRAVDINNICGTFFKGYKKFTKPIRTTYSNIGGAIANADRNHLFVVFMTNFPADLGSPHFIGRFRVVFKEN